MPFGLKMQMMRICRELNQKELAEIAGINNGYISWIETGMLNATAEQVQTIRRALNWAPWMDALLEKIHEGKWEDAA
ncbi:MAG: helix-turn-helix domain-containing protein [Anaerolineae bacterium]